LATKFRAVGEAWEMPVLADLSLKGKPGLKDVENVVCLTKGSSSITGKQGFPVWHANGIGW